MKPPANNVDPHFAARRAFLGNAGLSLGAIALNQLLSEPTRAAVPLNSSNPLAAKPPHFAPKAKRVIYLFMGGAPSHLELFDHKPQLTKFDGQLPPASLLAGYRSAFINA